MFKKGILLFVFSALVMFSSGCPTEPIVLAPAAPSNFTATALSPSEIALEWIDNSTNESSFIIERCLTGSGPWVQIVVLASNSESYTDSGLTQNTQYYYRIYTSNSAGDSAYASANATTETPAAPVIFGTWSCPLILIDGGVVTSAVITFNEDGTIKMYFQMLGGPQMIIAAIDPITVPADTKLTCTVDTFIGTEGPTPGSQFYLRYSNLTATTVGMEMDKTNDGFEGPYTLSKETPPATDKIFGTWACDEMIADGMTMDAVFLTMNEDATFSIVMYTTDLGYQTGTFAPTNAPADTTLTFTVASSSGPGAPPVGTDYYLKYSNRTDYAVDVYLDPMADLDWDGPFDYIR
jgi:hypothetical protein